MVRVIGVADDSRIRREDVDHRQRMPLADLVVVEVVRRRDLDHAGAELAVDIVVGDHRDQPAGQWQGDGPAIRCA